jgi:hypothetical protein
VQTGLDAAATAADVVTTNADVVTTNSDAASASASAAAAAASASEGLYRDVVTVNFAASPYTIVSAQDGDLFKVDTSGGNVVINLPDLSLEADDFRCAVVKETGDANTITVQRQGTDTINGGTSQVLEDQYKAANFVGDQSTTSYIALATTIADALLITNNLSDVASAVTARANLGLAIGTDVQAHDAELAAIAGLSVDPGGDELAYFTGTATAALTGLTAAGRALIDDDSASAQRTTLGIETFTSAEQTITSGGLLTVAHGLGVDPGSVEITLICKTAELGWGVGDVIRSVPLNNTTAATSKMNMMYSDATNINLRMSDVVNVFAAANKTTGAASTLTNANWKIIFRAQSV